MSDGKREITADDVQRIQALDLRDDRVQQALAGFLAREIQNATANKIYISPKILHEAMGRFVAAMKLVPEAAAIINERNRDG